MYQTMTGYSSGERRLDLGHGLEVEEECAMEKVLSHHGTKGNVLFEIK
jgi:hypothetical protein